MYLFCQIIIFGIQIKFENLYGLQLNPLPNIQQKIHLFVHNFKQESIPVRMPAFVVPGGRVSRQD